MNSELVGSMRNTERMMFNSIHNVEIPSKMSYLLFISSLCQNCRIFLARIAEFSLPESQNFPCQNRTILENNSPIETRRIAKCSEIKIVSAVNQICHFGWTKKKKSCRKLTVVCHRHPTELPQDHLFLSATCKELAKLYM